MCGNAKLTNPALETEEVISPVTLSCQRTIAVWRLYIDGKDQDTGRMTYDAGLHRLDDPEKKEPGYIRAIENAHEYAFSKLNERITVEAYKEIHKRATYHWQGVHPQYKREFKSRECFMEFKNDFSGLDPLTRRDMQEVADLKFDPKTKLHNLTFLYGLDNPAEIEKKLNEIIAEFYQEIGTCERDDDRFYEIARFHKRLEYLHPYQDGNTRTNLVVLNKVLSDFNFGVVNFDNPNINYWMTSDEWAAIIRQRYDLLNRADRKEDEHEQKDGQ